MQMHFLLFLNVLSLICNPALEGLCLLLEGAGRHLVVVKFVLQLSLLFLFSLPYRFFSNLKQLGDRVDLLLLWIERMLLKLVAEIGVIKNGKVGAGTLGLLWRQLKFAGYFILLALITSTEVVVLLAYAVDLLEI